MALIFVLNDESVNSYGTRVLIESIRLDNFLENPVMLWNHTRAWSNKQDQILPIGKWGDLRVEQGKLLGGVVFDEKDGFAQRIKNKMEQGIISMCSVSIDVITSSNDTSIIVQGRRRPTIIECELREVSIVGVDSNRNAVRLFDVCDGKEICLSDNSGDNFLLPLLGNIHKDNHMELKEMKDLLELRDKEDGEVRKEILRLRDLDHEVVTLCSEKQQLEKDLRAYHGEGAAERQRAIVKLVDDAVGAYEITTSEKKDYIALAEKDYERAKKILNARSDVQQPSVSQTDENNVWQQRFRQIEESNQ